MFAFFLLSLNPWVAMDMELCGDFNVMLGMDICLYSYCTEYSGKVRHRWCGVAILGKANFSIVIMQIRQVLGTNILYLDIAHAIRLDEQVLS